jgi:hypothetical protein
LSLFARNLAGETRRVKQNDAALYFGETDLQRKMERVKGFEPSTSSLGSSHSSQLSYTRILMK